MTDHVSRITIRFENNSEQDLAYHILVQRGGLAKMIERDLGVKFERVPGGFTGEIGEVVVRGSKDAVSAAESMFKDLKAQSENNPRPDKGDVSRALDAAKAAAPYTVRRENAAGKAFAPATAPKRVQIHLANAFTPLSQRQDELWKLFDHKDIVFSEGPAGTGKTRTAIEKACNDLAAGKVEKIILSRAAVPNGRDPGAVPGGYDEKYAAYMQPLIDELNEVLGGKQVEDLRKKGVIQIVPFEMVQGRTFKDAFVVLDEAQNTFDSQMESFLTRFGQGSKMAVLGSHAQTIQQEWRRDAMGFSGLSDAIKTLEGASGIGVIRFTAKDVVRSGVVQTIVEAYEKKREAFNKVAAPRNDNDVLAVEGFSASLGDHVRRTGSAPRR